MSPWAWAIPMTSNAPIPETCDVAIVGGGPAGLAAATCLKQAGVGSVHILEREPDAGGIPRHCGHPPFGMREFTRCMTGPAYARALVKRALGVGVKIHVNTTVVSIQAEGRLAITTTDGVSEIVARRVIICTGVRETPRSARLISGQRPLGITTTGALQSMVYLKDNRPFRRPVIVGTELVSFSALLTARHAGIKPVAMIEENNCITARAFCRPLPTLLGVPLHLNTAVEEILGKDRVSGLRVTGENGAAQIIDCDGVLFTGQFTPESSLMRLGHLRVDQRSGGPMVDQYGRCSDPTYFATGNLLRPVETAGWCWQEGVSTAAAVLSSLNGQLPDVVQQIDIISRHPIIKLAVPQILSPPVSPMKAGHIQLRFTHSAKGRLSVMYNGQVTWTKDLTAKPERRVLIPIPELAGGEKSNAVEIKFEETS
jgi:thioredoxin reductase